MPVTVVVGGQFGSEGKGKVAHFLAKEKGAAIAVRVGGVNSGHTVVDPYGRVLIFRQLPTASILPDVTCILPAGCYIDTDILLEEIKKAGISEYRLIIDPNAMIIIGDDRAEEQADIKDTIGSTASGTGAAVKRRVGRTLPVKFAKDETILKQFIRPTTPLMREYLDNHKRIIIEGTQGYGLSLLHSRYYPFVTSRDTTAAAFVSEAGLSPLDVDEVVLTIRAFPIRVGGNSGPLPNEIDWDIITRESGSMETIREYTSVTKRMRRVARFNPDVVKEAIQANYPTEIVLNHLDYIDAECKKYSNLTEKVHLFIWMIEKNINRQIAYFGFGPDLIIHKHHILKGDKKCLI